MNTNTASVGGFSTILSRAWVWGYRLLWIAGAGVLFFIVLEMIHLHDMLDNLHPALAWAVTALLAVLLIGWPAWIFAKYARMPRVITPPSLPPIAKGWNEAQQKTYRKFAASFLRRQQKNPHLDPDAKTRIPAAIEKVTSGVIEATDPAAAAAEIETMVQREVNQVLEPLDAEAKRLIRRASVEVALATAVSPSILLDSMITFNRNLDLIAKLANLYYGRPGLLGTFRITRDVIGSAITAGALEVVSDHLSGAITEMAGSWSSRLIGPLGQGMINGVVTMRFGAAAQMRCRNLKKQRVPWQRWRLGDYRRAVSGLLNWVTEDVGPSVFGPLEKVVMWTGKATESTVRGGVGLLSFMGGKVKDAFAGKKPEAETGEQRPLTGDPVLDGGFLD